VRGDSRLDFFAKSLAVAGLGLIGATGALIDYWPAPMRLPQVDRPTAQLVAPTIHTFVDIKTLDDRTPAAGAIASRAAFDRPASRAIHPAFARALPIDVAAGPAGETGAAAIDATSRGDAHLPVESATLAALLPAVALADETPATLFQRAEDWRSRPPVAMASDRADDGFLSGVLKKTGSSVSTSIGKASTSLVGAVRAVGDAVKKAF